MSWNTCRLIITGAFGVGKTSVCRSLRGQEFEEKHLSTVVADVDTIDVKEVKADGHTYPFRDAKKNVKVIEHALAHKRRRQQIENKQAYITKEADENKEESSEAKGARIRVNEPNTDSKGTAAPSTLAQIAQNMDVEIKENSETPRDTMKNVNIVQVQECISDGTS